MVEKSLTCTCGTREEEWDETQGGDRNAYFAKVYICPGCKKAGDAIDGEIEDRRRAKGSVNGVKARLVSRESWMTQIQKRKKKQ